MGVLVWLFYLRLCAYLGSKRIIGAFDAVMLGLFLSVVGLYLILRSRELLDEKADAALIKEYKRVE